MMTQALTVLAIDQARVSGFAFGRAGEVPKSGLMTIPKCRDDYEYFWQVQEAVRMKIEQYKPDVFAFEQPFFSPKTAHSGTKLMGCAAVIKALLHEMRIKTIYEVPNGTWKKSMTGSAKFNKGTRPYPPIDNAHMRGWRTGDSHDRADALGIWLHACMRAHPEMNLDLPLLAS